MLKSPCRIQVKGKVPAAQCIGCWQRLASNFQKEISISPHNSATYCQHLLGLNGLKQQAKLLLGIFSGLCTSSRMSHAGNNLTGAW